MVGRLHVDELEAQAVVEGRLPRGWRRPPELLVPGNVDVRAPEAPVAKQRADIGKAGDQPLVRGRVVDYRVVRPQPLDDRTRVRDERLAGRRVAELGWRERDAHGLGSSWTRLLVSWPRDLASRRDAVTNRYVADSRSYGWPSAAGGMLRPTTPARITIVTR